MSERPGLKHLLFVQVDYQGQEFRLSTFPNEYRSLMMLIYDRIYTEDFGECLGMGKCGTCRVQLLGKARDPSCLERNGEANLIKAGLERHDIQLACQILIDENIDGLHVKILN